MSSVQVEHIYLFIYLVQFPKELPERRPHRPFACAYLSPWHGEQDLSPVLTLRANGWADLQPLNTEGLVPLSVLSNSQVLG